MIRRYVRSGRPDVLRDAELLAGAVADIHSGTATEASAMAGYQTTRDALAGRLFGTVETIASFSWTIRKLRRLLLEASSAMSEQARLCRALISTTSPGQQSWRAEAWMPTGSSSDQSCPVVVARLTESVHEDTMSQTAVAHRERVLPELREHRPHNACTREDDVGPLGL